MTTKFASADEAIRAGVECTGFKLDEVTLTPILEKVLQFGTRELLEDQETTPEFKSAVQKRIDAQQTYRIEAPDGNDRRISVGPFRDGFECWLITPSGASVRM